MSCVVVVDWDPSWPEAFETLRHPIWKAIAGHALRIEHIGSTAVPGLAAKPVIDMTIVVADEARLPSVITILEPLGYRHRGDLGITGREAFYTPPEMPRHNLYACVEDSLPLRNHLAVRNLLRQDPGAVREYGLLKKRLARQFPNDVSAYCAAKSDFLQALLSRSGFTIDDLAVIQAQNSNG